MNLYDNAAILALSFAAVYSLTAIILIDNNIYSKQMSYVIMFLDVTTIHSLLFFSVYQGNTASIFVLPSSIYTMYYPIIILSILRKMPINTCAGGIYASISYVAIMYRLYSSGKIQELHAQIFGNFYGGNLNFLNEIIKGTSLLIAGVIGCITARNLVRAHKRTKEISNNLEENRLRLEGISSNIQGILVQFILHTDSSIEILYLSKSIRYFIDFDLEEIKNNPNVILNLIAPNDIQEIEARLEASRWQPGAWKQDFRVLQEGKPERWFRFITTPVNKENGKVLCNSLILDIQKEKETEERLTRAKEEAEQANKTKQDFLANMSHELRTPLNGIIGMAELLLDTELSAVQKEYLETLRNSGETLLSIINDILDFTKIEAGKLSLKKQVFLVEDLLKETFTPFLPTTSQKKINLYVRYDEKVPKEITASKNRFRQILINIIGNAVKFTYTGYILVTVGFQQNPIPKIRFSIKDTGIGIPEKHLTRVFEKFTQVDSSLRREFTGTGLGLSISKQLSSLLGGDISVQSEQGLGTEFLIELPVTVNSWEKRRHSITKVVCISADATEASVLESNLSFFYDSITVYSTYQDAKPAIDKYADVFYSANAQDVPDNLSKICKASYRINKRNLKQNSLSSTELVHPLYLSSLADTVKRDAPAQEQSNETQSKTTKLQVLLAEDNDINQRVLTAMLERSGCTVETAKDGAEATAFSRNKKYDLIFMDCQMPGTDGIEATIRIRGSGKNQNTPIIAVTGHAMHGDRERFLQKGMNDYIAKPITKNIVQEKLEKWAPDVETKADNSKKINLDFIQLYGFHIEDPKDLYQNIITEIMAELETALNQKSDEHTQHMQEAARLLSLAGKAETAEMLKKGQADIQDIYNMLKEECDQLRH